MKLLTSVWWRCLHQTCSSCTANRCYWMWQGCHKQLLCHSALISGQMQFTPQLLQRAWAWTQRLQLQHMALASAFSALQTLSDMPDITYTARTHHIVPVGAALTPLQQTLKALRMRGCKPFMDHLTLQLQPLHQLQRLCLYLIEPQLISALLGLAAHVPQLRHLMLTFLRKPCRGPLHAIAAMAAELPDLQTLAMPPYVMCDRCAPKSDARACLHHQEKVRTLQCRLIALGCCPHCHHAGTSSTSVRDDRLQQALELAHLQALELLHMTAPPQSCSCCTTEQQQQQQPAPGLSCLPTEQGKVGPDTGQSCEEGVWGVYGPAKYW